VVRWYGTTIWNCADGPKEAAHCCGRIEVDVLSVRLFSLLPRVK